MSGTEALIPSADEVVPQRKPRPEAETLEELQADDAIYASLADHPGWELFRNTVLKRADDMERLAGAKIEGMPLEEVGKRYVVAREAAAVLRNEIKTVEATAQVVHEQAANKPKPEPAIDPAGANAK